MIKQIGCVLCCYREWLHVEEVTVYLAKGCRILAVGENFYGSFENIIAPYQCRLSLA